MASLLVVQGKEQGKRFTLGNQTVQIGRESGIAVRLKDTEVSRRHAEIRVEGPDYFVVDLGSSNGTFLNDLPVKKQRLSGGDRIQVGQTVILFALGQAHDRDDLADRINLFTRARKEKQASIVGTVSHVEGSQYLRELPSRDPAELQTAVSHLKVMYDVSQAVAQLDDIERMFDAILELAFQSVPAERGAVLLCEERTRKCKPVSMFFRGGSANDEEIDISNSIVEYVLKNHEGVRTSDASLDDRFSGQSIDRMGIREALCVPMIGRSGSVGVIYLDNRLNLEATTHAVHHKFSDETLKLMLAIASQAALSVENSRYHAAKLQAERMAAIGQTVATISHHVKNILQGVKGGSHLIEMGLDDGEDEIIRRGWKIVNRNQTRIFNLVMDMLSYSKEREPVLEPTDLSGLLKEIVELMEQRAEECGVKLELQLNPVPQMMLDPEGIHRAVLNIVSNAIDATESVDEGVVIIRAIQREDSVTVIVRDNGVGIPDEQLEDLFQLFESTKGARGTGIGLAVSEKIIREHGGTIDVQSREGVGTAFHINLAQPKNPTQTSESIPAYGGPLPEEYQ